MALSTETPTRAFSAALAGDQMTEQRATPALAFARARELIRSGQRLDMAALANEIGVSRATVYRWTGDRDRLLGDVIWLELSGLIDHVNRAAPGHGAQRLTAGVGAFLDALTGNVALQRFLENEGEAGLQLATALDGGVRPRLVAAVAQIIAEEPDYDPPDSPELLADGIIALAERWLYHNGDRSRNPDPATAKRMIALLLREPSDAAL